ncbi:MAG: TatD family hydrolase [Candidatus Omnitrophota bacterium]
MLIDTHCHLDFPQFDPDRDKVIERAIARGVGRLINVGADLRSSAASIELAGKYAAVFAAVGVHPHEADAFTKETFLEIAALAKHKKVVAIGEIGLDFYRNLSKADSQERVFKELIALAKDLNLPVIVHSRQADKRTLEILKEMMPLRAVIHCFSGDKDFLDECLKLGFLVSFTCNITYAKAEDLRQVAITVPLEKIMLETDAPYLPPQEERGKRNEPVNVKAVAFELAKLKGIEFGKVEEATSSNAFNFFKLQ